MCDNSAMNLKYDNYIFDLYGTLIDLDSNEMVAQTWKKFIKWLDKREILHPDYITMRREFFEMDKAARIKLTAEKGIKYPEIDVLPIYKEQFQKYGNLGLDDELIENLSYAFRESSIKSIGLYDGVIEYLNALKKAGKKIYILSNAQRSYTWPEVEMFGFDKIMDDVLISSDDYYMKPQVEYFDRLFKKHNLSRETSVMIGDSYSSDIQGAINYGIDYIHLTGDKGADKFYLNELSSEN